MGANKEINRYKTTREANSPAANGRKVPTPQQKNPHAVTATNTTPSKTMICAMGGDNGGMPVNNDDTKGVSAATASAYFQRTRNAAIDIGKNMGRNTFPKFNAWNRMGMSRPSAMNSAARARFWLPVFIFKNCNAIRFPMCGLAWEIPTWFDRFHPKHS